MSLESTRCLIDWGDHLDRSGDFLVWRSCDQPHKRECFPLSLCNLFAKDWGAVEEILSKPFFHDMNSIGTPALGGRKDRERP